MLGLSSLPASIFKPRASFPRNEVKTLDKRQALNQFLASVEKRAFRMADLATGDPDHAMDIVQDAMMSLVKNYSHKNEADWGPLFHRILQSKIRDWYRRSRTRNRVFGWLYPSNYDDNDNDDELYIMMATTMSCGL